MTLSLWNPMDHSTRRLQPWRNLSTGPVEPSRSLLLDHVTQLKPIVLASAKKHNNPLVICSSMITIFLTIAVSILSDARGKAL
jgi:hypothetical protein